MARRVFDVILAVAGLIIASPLMMLVALAIRAESGGPVLFRQERVGLGGRLFRIRKFRTMVIDAERLGIHVTATTDSRITGVGRFLRRYKLDELPQLLDVLVGNMSIVGPRPEVPQYVKFWPEEARRKILRVRPGITDPIALEYFEEGVLLAQSDDPERTYIQEILPRKVRGYTEYLERRSMVVDASVIARTIWRAFRG